MRMQKQNPGLAPRASRNQLVGCLHSFPTASDKQVQMLVCRFCLSPTIAREMARLCFGETLNE